VTERFKKIVIPFIFKWEGTKFEDDPSDPGGATRYGIDQRSHPNVDIRHLTEQEAMDIYWNEYWIKCGCDHMDWPMSFIWFNCCVNCGIGRAQKILKISGKDPRKFLDEQEDFYRRLVQDRPRSQKFLKGWLNRTQDLRKTVLGA
jgi:lysozyme family protein